MHKKILILVLFLPLVFGSYAHAMILLPFFNISINENAIGGDGNFNFHIKQYNANSPLLIFSKDFSIQTSNGLGLDFTSGYSSFGDYYYITQDLTAGWQNNGVVCTSDNLSVTTVPVSGGVLVTAYPFTNIVCNFSNTKVNSKIPVLIVPGVLGTEMKKGNTILWASVLRMVNPLNSDNFMDPLVFKVDRTPLDTAVYPSKVIDNPDGLFDYSEGLIKEFTDQGYVQGANSEANLFTFPYDWRYGISGIINGTSSTTVDLLQTKIEEIRNQTHSDKVDIIAHSTGGLIVKKYVMEHPDNSHIGKAVFVGVPNLGAPKAIKALLTGDNFGVHGLEDSEMKKIAENLPVTYDLAPSQKYYNTNGSFVRVIEQKFLAPDPVKDLSYQETKGFLLNEHGFNQDGYQSAQGLHTEDFDSFDMRNKGVDVYSITGCKSGTIGKVVEKWFKDLFGHTKITYEQPEELSGDSTVPFESSDFTKADDNKRFYAIKADHGKMPSAEGIRQEIVNIIVGSNLTVGNNIITKQQLLGDPKQCELKGKKIKIQSPLAIEVVDQNSNRLGFATDGSLQNDIPGADFSVFGDHKFLFLPEDDGQVYQINLNGTGVGIFTLGVTDIEGNQVLESQNFINVPVSASTLGTLSFNFGEATLSLDTNGDGAIDQTVEPSSILDSNQSQDLTPPISTSTITGLMGQEGFYRSNATVTLSSIDPIVNNNPSQTSGVLKTQYNLDNQGYQSCPPSLTPPQQGGECSVPVTTEGQHTLTFFSTDRAGDNETEQTINFIIDKTPPEFVMQFNPPIKDVEFTGTDNLSSSSNLTVLDQDNLITLTDQAGNTSQITLKDKDRKQRLKAEIKSLSYNSQPQDISKTEAAFDWEFNRQGVLKELEQHIKSKKDFNIEAHYENGRTKIEGKDENGKIRQTFAGLMLLRVFTKNGDLGWGY